MTLDIDLILGMWLLKRGEKEKKSKFASPFPLLLREKMKAIKICSWKTSQRIIYTATHRLVTVSEQRVTSAFNGG